jgi:hypothetical protein
MIKGETFYTHTIDGMEQSLPYNLPEGKVGKFSIRHRIEPAGSEMVIVSMRTAIMTDVKPVKTVISEPVRIHELVENGKGLWMSSKMCDIWQHQEALKNMHGRVLVGGLGIGLAVSILEKNPRVTEIVCVEKNPQVIDLVFPHLSSKKTLIRFFDLFQYLNLPRLPRQKNADGFDFAFYDIWCSTGQTQIKEFTLPLRQLSRGIIPQKNIVCWQEDEMIGQVILPFNISDESLVSMMSMVFSLSCDRFKAHAKHSIASPVWQWFRSQTTKPTAKQLRKMANRFVAALKNADHYEKDWKQWEVKQ